MAEIIKTILVPTDGSPHARKALAFACDLSVKYEARLIVLHVLVHKDMTEALRNVDARDRTIGARDETLVAALGDRRLKELMATKRNVENPEFRDVLEYIAKKVIADAEAVARLHGVGQIKTAVEDGDPVKRILEYAEKENADLIVMGSRGLSDIEGLLLGSTSQQVGHLCQCTCVTVK